LRLLEKRFYSSKKPGEENRRQEIGELFISEKSKSPSARAHFTPRASNCIEWQTHKSQVVVGWETISLQAKVTMIRRERTCNSFPATIALEKEMNALKGKTFYDQSSPGGGEMFILPCLTEEDAEPFPIIEWCENDEIDDVSDEDSMNPRKRRNVADYTSCPKKRKTHGLIRSKNMKSQLFILDVEEQPSESPSKTTSFIGIKSVYIETILQITTNEAQVNIVA
jgi:hypothetical protein